MIRLAALFLMMCASAVIAGPPPEVASATPSTTAFDFAHIELPAHLYIEDVPEADTLTLEQSLRMAFERSPGLAAARERVEMARGEYRSRSAANNPQAFFGGTLVPRPSEGNDTRSQLPDSDQTYLSYTFPTSGKRRYGAQAADARVDAARRDLRTAELDLELAVKQAYVDLQVADETLGVHEDSYRIASAFIDLARRQVAAGAVPETNVVRTQVETARVEQELRKAQGELLVREEVLGFQLVRPPGQRIAAADPLEPAAPPGSLPDLLARAERLRPETAAAAANIAALGAEVKLARAERRPDLTVETSFTTELTNTENPPHRAFVQLPLWDRGKIAGQVERARAEMRAAEHALALARRQVGLDVARSYRQVQSAQAVVRVFHEQVLPRTGTLLERARIAYLAGAGTLLDVLDAQRVYRQAALEGVAATGDLARAVAALERAVAAPLRHP